MSRIHNSNILLVDDEEMLARILQKQLESVGAKVCVAGDLTAARKELELQVFDLVLLDKELPDGNGFELLQEIRVENQDVVPVVILTGAATLEGAVEATRLGATDYIAKPDDMQQTLLAVEKSLVRAEDQQKGFYALQRQSRAKSKTQWIGQSEEAQKLQHGIERLGSILRLEAEQLPAVLLVGETGSGKSVSARLLHQASPRHKEPFLQVDCGSLPGALIEGELFGHSKGAFTQAHEARVGLMEAAEGGVLFLDEIAEIPLPLQAKLLATLDRRTVRRVGSNLETPIRAAIIAATNRDLAEMVEEGTFRQDLYYRLFGLTLTIPPLRERKADIADLAEAFLLESSALFHCATPTLSPGALKALQDYVWPGNVRELKNVLARLVILADGEEIRAEELPLPTQQQGAGLLGRGQMKPWEDLSLQELEREAVRHALEASEGNVSRAARRLGLSRGALRNRIQRLGLG
ncbi:MAG: sigma-54 dependent transcriptional regulator [Planctomycetota bacterium]